MSSCHWALPVQLHPWYKSPTLKRKPSAMLPRSESPFPEDEYDSDSRVKRQRRITLDQTRSKKRNLPSPPQSPAESHDQHLPKRQRCTTLERGLEGLSLTPPALAAQQAPEFASCLPAPVSAVLAHPPDFSSRWPEMSLTMPCSRPIPSPSPSPPTSIPFTSASTTSIPPTPALTADLHAAPDVKMRTSSWYEPEKDRIVVTDLDVSSDDEADTVDDVPKLPRAVLKALMCGPERDSLQLAGLRLWPPQLSQSLDPPLLDSARLSVVGLDEAMDVEQ